MSSLRTQIEVLAMQFSDGILAAIRKAPTSELGEVFAAGGDGSVLHTPARRGRPKGSGTKPAVASTAPTAAAKAPKFKPGGRRSAAELQQVLTAIGAALKGQKEGLSSEQLQKTLGLSKPEITGVITLGLAQNNLRKTGQKRGTRYFAR
ncbi:hypothetical protein BH09MYX1_BH09MYX1_45170 [soil metagenome]